VTQLSPIVDVDIHHNVRSDADLLPYLPEQWRAYVRGNGREQFPVYSPPAAKAQALIPNRGQRADAYPADGTRSGSSYDVLREQLLDRYGYSRALLTHQLGDSQNHLNHYYAEAVCRAVNDWNIDSWLSLDDRLYSVLVVPSQMPERAAAEIRRVGGHPKIAGVLLSGNALGRPIGDPLYDPIHRAAAEFCLPLVLHIASSDRPTTMIRTAGGPKPTIMEGVAEGGQGAAHYISSLLVHGVFERYSGLRVLFNEYGVSWLPSIVWGLDQNYEVLRFESGLVKRWPSEYIHDHILFSTQPLEESADDKRALGRLLESIDGVEEILCFSSDYPHISFDDPLHAAKILPARWHRNIFWENACRLFGWPAPLEAVAASG
jgi:predicted TIM-barrel fold metal-dependent hydrolase